MSERQTLTWAACDALAASGKKPSIGLVREWTLATTGAKKGSDGDVQQDIHQWYDDLLKLKRDKAIVDLPAAVSALARDFWRLAVDAANDSVAAERATLAEEKKAAEKRIDLAQQDTVAAVDIANQLKGKLAIAHEAIAGRDDAIKRLEASLAEIRATLQAKDERIEGLSAELARKAAEHAAGLAEREGVRKHTLLQIDQARAEARHWKTEFERVDHENKSTVETYRQKAATLANELAAAQGRLGAVEDSLVNAQHRVQALEAELSAAVARKSAAKAATATKRFGMGKPRGTVNPIRRRK